MMRKWTFVLNWTLSKSMNCDAFRLTDIVAASSAGCVVLRYKTKDKAGVERAKLGKFAVPETGLLIERFDKEKKNVEMLKKRNLVVGSQANVETVLGHEAIVFDDSLGAVSLEKHVLSLGANEAALNEVAVLVKTTITKQLEKLHAEKLVFVDIHPGNIVGSRNADGKLTDVWLIDYECVCAVGTLFGHNDIIGRKWFVPRKYREAGAKASVDGDFESLSLVLAWILNLDDFRLLISSAPSNDKSAGNSQWENINASALVDLKKWMAEHDAATSSTSTSVSAASENKKG